MCPTARSGHSAVVAKESLYIFGGCGHPAVGLAGRSPAQTSTVPEAEFDREAMPVCLRDLHVYDLARQRWSEVIPQDLSVTPVERTCAAMCASEEEDRLFLSGGAGDDHKDLRADLLEFHVRRRTWRLLFDGNESSPHSACRRIGHAMVHDSARNRLVMFGGSTGECNGMACGRTAVVRPRLPLGQGALVSPLKSSWEWGCSAGPSPLQPIPSLYPSPLSSVDFRSYINRSSVFTSHPVQCVKTSLEPLSHENG